MFVSASRLVIPVILFGVAGAWAQGPQSIDAGSATSVLPPSVVVSEPVVTEAQPAEIGVVEGSRPSTRVEANRAYRQEIRSMDILERPYRNPLHVYGNTVRRRHERGAFPLRSLWQ